MKANGQPSHSAEVEAWLDCGSYGRLELSRITPTAVFAKAPQEIPPCYAVLVVVIDGKEHRSRVNLTNGFPKGRRFARALPVDDSVPI